MTYTVNGIDVSRYQAQDPAQHENPKMMDWQQALDAGIDFAFIRCGLGTIQDWTYEYNRAECERLKIPFGVYHAFWPSVDLDKQIKFVVDRMAGELYPVADIERDLDYSQSELSKRTRYYVEGLASVRKPMIYTRATFWDPCINATWGGAYPLWVAHYKDSGQPWIPIGWDGWHFWQWSADGNGQGAKYGAQSRSIDLNHYWGSLTDFGWEFDTVEPLPEPEPIPCATRFRVLVDVLNVRTGPGTNYSLAKGDNKLAKGEIVEAVDIAGANVWVEIAPGRWSAMKINSTEYMELI
jgi:GH25 family lysozyme M1 (1,4-beta-N-acetylmuramidase)